MSPVIQPSVSTQVPGPVSQATAKKLHEVFDARAISFVVDYKKSEGP